MSNDFKLLFQALFLSVLANFILITSIMYGKYIVGPAGSVVMLYLILVVGSLSLPFIMISIIIKIVEDSKSLISHKTRALQAKSGYYKIKMYCKLGKLCSLWNTENRAMFDNLEHLTDACEKIKTAYNKLH